MNVLGISFGRKMKNCEITVKQALKGAEAAGANVKFIRAIDLEIGHCIGCGACSAGRSKGKPIRCVLKDDYEQLAEAVLDADAVIVSAPVYVLGPVGQLKNFIDRFGPAHDYAAMIEDDKKAKEAGLPGVDPRAFKRRAVGYISVGGASTPNWVSMGLPGMYLFGFSNLMQPVDQIDAYDMGRRASPFLDDKLMARLTQLGRNVAEAAEKDPENRPWMGDDAGVCPVCHNNLVSLAFGTTTVECPLCGIEGKLSIEGDKVKVDFSAQQQARARGTLAGLYEHVHELAGMKDVAIPKIQANKDFIAEKSAEYEAYLAD